MTMVKVEVHVILTLKQLDIFFQNATLFSNVVHYKHNIEMQKILEYLVDVWLSEAYMHH